MTSVLITDIPLKFFLPDSHIHVILEDAMEENEEVFINLPISQEEWDALIEISNGFTLHRLTELTPYTDLYIYTSIHPMLRYLGNRERLVEYFLSDGIHDKIENFEEIIEEIGIENLSIYQQLSKGHFDMVKWLYNKKVRIVRYSKFYKRCVLNVFKNNWLNILKWLDSISALDHKHTNMAIMVSNKEVCKWMMTNISCTGINLLRFGDVDFMKDMMVIKNIKLGVCCINTAVKSGNFEMVGWLYENGYKYNRSYLKMDLERSNNLRMIKCAHKYGEDMSDVLNIAIKNNNLDIIQWLKTIGIYPNRDDINLAVSIGNIKILTSMIEKHDYNMDLIQYASLKGNIYVARWLIEKGYVITSTAVVNAAKNGHTDVLKLLLDNNGVLVKEAAKAAEDNYHLKTLKFIRKRGGNWTFPTVV